MRKLTGNAKYEIVDGDLNIYLRRKATRKWECVGSCHLSWIDTIKTHGLVGAIKVGLVLSQPAQYDSATTLTGSL